MADKETIYNEILNRIIHLEYKPGDIIEEKKIAKEFNVSRTPVREALLFLSGKGLVQMIPRMGTYVSQIDIKKVKNAYQVKKKLESYAAELASEYASDGDIGELFEITKEMSTYNGSPDYEKYIQKDYEFFKKLRSLTRNELLEETLEELNNSIVRFLRYIQYVCDNPKWHVQSLESIAQSIKIRDPETASKETEYFDAVYVKKLFNTYFG
ncbi:MAG: GntR family transcriptional regulator [Tissierellales bacterium]|nr:GntR family transcriptional regulator [Tissierellales bacterium]